MGLHCRQMLAPMLTAAPQRLQSSTTAARSRPGAPAPLPVFAVLPSEIGPLALNKIRDNYGARKQKRRVGRGQGSGRGNTCGRGQKGKGARTGNHGFLKQSGGQTPFWKMIPKRGFFRPKREYKLLRLHFLERCVLTGRLPVPEDRPITVRDLFLAKMVTLRQRHSGVKLIGGGAEYFNTPLNIEVQLATKPAIEAIERAGGKITTVYYSRLTLRGLLKPEKILAKNRLLPRPSLPPPKLMAKYLDEEKRGYLVGLKPGDILRPHEQPSHVRMPPEDPMPGGPE